MIRRLPIAIIVAIIIMGLNSCKEKLTCDNPKSLQLVKENVKHDIVEAWALKLAADDFKDYRKDWIGDMSRNYEKYLVEKLREIRYNEGEYFEKAMLQYKENDVLVEDILLVNYDEEIDKCDCSAKIILTNSTSTNKVEYEVVKNTEGEMSGNYRYVSKIMLDEEHNATEFIKKHKHLLD